MSKARDHHIKLDGPGAVALALKVTGSSLLTVAMGLTTGLAFSVRTDWVNCLLLLLCGCALFEMGSPIGQTDHSRRE